MSRRGGTPFIPADVPLPRAVIPLDRAPVSDRRVTGALMGVSATALGAALQVRDGLYQPWGILWLTVALLAALAAFVLPPLPGLEKLGVRPLVRLLAVGLAIEFLQLLFAGLPGSWHGVDADWRFRFALVCAAVLTAGVLFVQEHARVFFLLLVATFLLMGTWIIQNVPRPYMDVWMVQTQTLRAFELRGVNPYAATYVDPYGRPDLYAPGAITDGIVRQGYPYPPVAFWMELPGYALGSDYRYASLAAMAGTALLIGFARRGRVGPVAAALFLFTPRAFFVLESGWTEPLSAVLLAAVAFFACRVHWPIAMNLSKPDPKSFGLAVSLGLFLASKQYLVFAVPVSILLLGHPIQWRRVGWLAARVLLVGCVASLPLILWNVPAFLQSTAGFAGAAGFRTDALNYLAMVAQTTGHVPSAALAGFCGVVAAVGGVGFCLRRGPRTAAGFAAAVALVYYLFFAFYKFAFCNYYYLILAACCCAIGASAATGEESEV